MAYVKTNIENQYDPASGLVSDLNTNFTDIESELDSGVVKTTGNQTIADTKTFSSEIQGDISGNAATATALETARTIAGQSFDGTANISIASTDLSDTDNIVNYNDTIKEFTGTGNTSFAGKVGIGLTPTANMAGISVESGLLTLKETTTPTSDANYSKIYTKNDNKLYCQDGAGTEHEVLFEDYIPAETFNIKMNAGTMDFSATNLVDRVWYSPEHGTSTAEKPAWTLTKAQTVRLSGKFAISPNCEINDNNTNTAYVGDLSDLPNLSYYLDLSVCTSVTGDLSDLPNLSYYLRLNNCSNITGTLASTVTATQIYLNNIGCSSAELDATIANIVTAAQTGGTLDMTGLTRTTASTTNVNTLISRGWSVTDATIA